MESKNPTHIAYRVEERGDDKKAIWTEVGIAWGHKDGEGLSLHLKALPLDGKVVLRTAKAGDDDADPVIKTMAEIDADILENSPYQI